MECVVGLFANASRTKNHSVSISLLMIAHKETRANVTVADMSKIILKKKENSNTKKLRKIFRPPGENRTHDSTYMTALFFNDVYIDSTS